MFFFSSRNHSYILKDTSKFLLQVRILCHIEGLWLHQRILPRLLDYGVETLISLKFASRNISYIERMPKQARSC